MATSIIKVPNILVEDKNVKFTSGAYVESAKTGYILVNAYARDRATSEANNYAITSIYGRTDGSYRLENKYTTLDAEMNVRFVWAKI